MHPPHLFTECSVAGGHACADLTVGRVERRFRTSRPEDADAVGVERLGLPGTCRTREWTYSGRGAHRPSREVDSRRVTACGGQAHPYSRVARADSRQHQPSRRRPASLVVVDTGHGQFTSACRGTCGCAVPATAARSSGPSGQPGPTDRWSSAALSTPASSFWRAVLAWATTSVAVTAPEALSRMAPRLMAASSAKPVQR
jgi:hypothetical protein